jgi:hypothetical protein
MDNKLHPQIKIGSGTIFLNPGTGAVEGALEANSIKNIKQFVKDCDPTLKWHWRRAKHLDYGNGRYAFLVFCDEFKKTKIEIQMPGWELSKVRFEDTESQDVWDFPRLYVEGSSWLWMFALLDRSYFDDPDEWTNYDDGDQP